MSNKYDITGKSITLKQYDNVINTFDYYLTKNETWFEKNLPEFK